MIIKIPWKQNIIILRILLLAIIVVHGLRAPDPDHGGLDAEGASPGTLGAALLGALGGRRFGRDGDTGGDSSAAGNGVKVEAGADFDGDADAVGGLGGEGTG